jgi:hypothetical protein
MSRPLPLHPLAWACVLLPVVAVHAGYLISIEYDKAVACVPYVSGCLSVSASVREPPAVHFYRALTLPAAGFTFVFWALVGRWIEFLGGPRDRALVLIGATGTVFMVLYAVFLGTDEPIYAKLRRFGIWFYFGLTYLALLLLTRRMLALRERIPRGVVLAQDALARLLLAIGVASVPIIQLWHVRWMGNILEWTGAMIMMAMIACVAEAWRRTGFVAEVGHR